MSIDNFIPEIWSAKLLLAYEKALVYGNCVNRDYEGEISAVGDKVRITSIGNVAIKDYVKNVDIAAPEVLADAQTVLEITQAKYYNFAVDDVDKRQAAGTVLNAGMKTAAYGLMNVSDTFIAGLYTGVAAGNTIGSDAAPIVPTAVNFYDYLVDQGVILDAADTPDDGRRFHMIPSWCYGLLLKDDRFVKYGDPVVRATGKLGLIDNSTVYKTNNVPNTAGTKYKIMSGHPDAIGYAASLTETEAYRPQKSFGDAVKGLMLFGVKLIRPNGIAVATMSKV